MVCGVRHYPEKPMIHPTQLSADVLAEIVSQIQQLLWLDTDGCGRSPDRATGAPRPLGEGLGVRQLRRQLNRTSELTYIN